MTLLAYRDLASHGITWSRTHLARLEAEGAFPKRIKIGPKSTRWLLDEVNAFKARAVVNRDVP
jgi:predicted DNA-binding transcriptional regulator AlpA